VSCTDKTGTLTQHRIILKRHLDVMATTTDQVLEYPYFEQLLQSGLKNLLGVDLQRERLNVTTRTSRCAGFPASSGSTAVTP